MCDDIVILARETIRESLIEARIDSMKAELEGLDLIADLEVQLAQKRAELSK